jgi:hypothetical protein
VNFFHCGLLTPGDPMVNDVPMLDENDELALNEPVLPVLIVRYLFLGTLTGADCRLFILKLLFGLIGYEFW